ncbi:hypothetical protein GGX14DRAFT_595027 [Mycena pura]|uniref:Uncharacterized protein n=1 Tax=Mycena pura TaxID=153505 RepID=A0AAD6YFG3_9AGAR|nr:hypothetical protein GGX14DRAFT_595027 [Mycena pura]
MKVPLLFSVFAKSVPDFRFIRPGDINLLSCVGKSDIVEYHAVRRKGRSGTVRVVTGTRETYHARIFPSQDTFTVVKYQESSFGKWKTDVMERQQLRTAPHTGRSFKANIIFEQEMLGVSADFPILEHADWLRASTGQLCIELGPSSGSYPFPLTWHRQGTADIPLSLSDTELVNMMDIEDLLEIFGYPRRTQKTISLHHGHVHLGALYSLHDEYNPYVPMEELLHIPETADPALFIDNWAYMDERFGAEDTGWTRIDLHRLHNLNLHTSGFSEAHHIFQDVRFLTEGNIERCWLAQANHFLSEHLFLTTGVNFYVTICDPTEDIGLRGTFMAGAPMDDLYLFLFHPCVDFQDGLVSVKIPSMQDAYYWSFWPDGREPLSAELLDEIMPPQILLDVEIVGKQWSQQDYELIRDITQAKGLDPESSKAPHECHGFKPVLYSRVFWLPNSGPVLVASGIRTVCIRGCQTRGWTGNRGCCELLTDGSIKTAINIYLGLSTGPGPGKFEATRYPNPQT